MFLKTTASAQLQLGALLLVLALTACSATPVADLAPLSLLAVHEQSACTIRSGGIICWGQDDDQLVGFSTDTHQADTTTTTNQVFMPGPGGGRLQTIKLVDIKNFECTRDPQAEPNLLLPPQSFGQAIAVHMFESKAARRAPVPYLILAMWYAGVLLLVNLVSTQTMTNTRTSRATPRSTFP